MKLHWMPFVAGAAMLGALGLTNGEAQAYQDYTTTGTDNCAQCHSTFVGGPGNALHNAHVAIITTCNACHPSGAGSTPVTLDTSGDNAFDISCMGCHGRAEDNGQPNSDGYGAGLRSKHDDMGQTICAGCHGTEINNYTPVGEDVLPVYYANPGNQMNIPADSCADVLDNDGDDSIDGTDGTDSDCSAAGGAGGAGTGGAGGAGTGGAGGAGTGGAGGAGTGGTTSSGTGGTTSSGTGGTTSSGTGGTTSSSSGDAGDAEEDDGCGCRVVAPSETPPAAPTLGLLGLGLLLARRRRRG
jgi:MYXO-CTERM domain-containing protein